MNLESRAALLDYINAGNSVKYMFFWGHQKPKSGISQTCFSQWYEAPFEKNGIYYQTAEHYMMAEKARLFDDEDIERKVIAANNPGEAKKLGRMVKNFDEQIWLKERFAIVVAGNLLKFQQNDSLREFLVSTGNRVIVEASPVDKIWGIGLAADNPAAENPNLWKGDNLLGFALMAVRKQLQENK